jgi:hypothetical protein
VLDLSGNVIAKSTARNKKVAEQEASRLALEIMSSDKGQNKNTEEV